jgi:hypothetical protein
MMTKVLYHPDSGVEGVRVATPADEDQIYMLLLMLHAENGMFGVNPAKVRRGIQHATQRQGGIIFCIDEGPFIVATLGLLITSDWYSDDEYLLERWNYVHPEYRKSNYARKLLEQSKWTSDFFTRGALKKGRPPMPFQCGINSFERTEGKVRLYARHMACIGAFFMYGVLPRQNERAQEEMRRIQAMNEKAHRERSREVVPLVEMILRVGGVNDHVR